MALNHLRHVALVIVNYFKRMSFLNRVCPNPDPCHIALTLYMLSPLLFCAWIYLNNTTVVGLISDDVYDNTALKRNGSEPGRILTVLIVVMYRLPR